MSTNGVVYTAWKRILLFARKETDAGSGGLNDKGEKMTKTYDTKCYELAEAFISDLKITSAEHHKQFCHELALQIQDVIEDYTRDLGKD